MNANRILTLDEVRAVCPAAFAQGPNPKVSDNYKFVPTHEVLSILEASDWVPIAAKQQKTRNPANMEGTKHSIMLRNRSIAVANPTLGGTVPTINILNSHDWSSRLVIDFGVFRLVCTNGMMVAGANFVAFNVRHDQIHEDLSTILSRFNSAACRIQETIEEWASIELNGNQIQELSTAAVRIRFGDEFSGNVEEVAWSMNAARRTADEGNSLWSTFNRLQESIVRGGYRAGKRRSREITNIASERSLNQSLFLRTEEMAKLLTQ